MTFKDLSKIISRRSREQLTQTTQQQQQLSPQEQQEKAEAQAVIEKIRANHSRAYHERRQKWCDRHGKSTACDLFNPTQEETRRDTEFDEWYWDFLLRIHGDENCKTPEQRYQNERSPPHGFGHVPCPKGIPERGGGDVNNCVPGCRFYEPTGRLTVFDILEDYRSYPQFDDVWRAYKELEAEGLLLTE